MSPHKIWVRHDIIIIIKVSPIIIITLIIIITIIITMTPTIRISFHFISIKKIGKL